jgi:hypothetical protein
MARLMRPWLIVLTVAIAVLVAAGAVAAGHSAPKHTTKPKPGPKPPVVRDTVQIQAVFDPDGDPLLVANFNGAGLPPRWSICSPAPKSSCDHLEQTKRSSLRPGPEPAGTVFVASAAAGGHTYTARVTWHGRVRALAPPRLLGPAKFGAHVSVAAGRWTGGWGAEFDQLGLEACKTRAGTECVVLSGGQYGCPGQPPNATVGGWLPGMFLFAYDLRLPHESACAGVGYSYPGAIPPWPAHPIVARSTPAGPVTGPPAPKVSILRTARIHRGRVFVAAVRCSNTCHVWLSVFDGQTSSGARVNVTGSATVAVPRARLQSGTLLVSLHVDDGPGISGRSSFR